MWAVFWISQVGPGAWLAEGVEIGNTAIPGLVTYIEMFGEWIGGLMANASPLLQTIIVDGIIGGVGAVLGFLPLVMVMYFMLALLEDCGYMSRVSVVLDPIFKKVGLSGKSVIPFIIGVGCAIPGVMASRTIRGENERRATAMLAPFMPCGAKLPVIALFARFFVNDWWVAPLMYFLGIAIIFFGALLVNVLTGQRKKVSYFIIELPEYKFPSLLGAVKSMLQRGWSYIVKAGTIILVCNAVVHLMSSFTWTFSEASADASDSILATIATPFGYIFAPIFGVIAVEYLWKLAAASITGFIAKENVAATLSVCFAFAVNDDLEVVGGLGELAVLPQLLAISYLMFNLFTPPCFAAIGAMNAEMNSKKWLFAGVGLQFGVGFTLSFLVTFFGTVFSDKLSYASVWMPILGWVIVAVIVAVFVYIAMKNRKAQAKAEKVGA
jgi:ferrous iron transport protein B